MFVPRIFVAIPLTAKQEITLDTFASHRILQVLRLEINAPLLIFNDTGKEYRATLTNISSKHKLAVVTLGNYTSCNNESPLNLHLGQGISRGEKMDFTIQKATELGVKIITPLFTEHCNVKLKDERLAKRHHHWQQVAISAAEQSGRCFVPKILPAQSLSTWCHTIIASSLSLILDPYAPNKISDLTQQANNIVLLVGPEGGLSNEEIRNATQNNFLPIKIGPRILRTETAALTAISIIQEKWGDF